MGEETPGERSLRRMREDPALLDSLAGNLYEAETGDDDWLDLPEYERAVWREKAIAAQVQYIALHAVLREVADKAALDDYLRDRGRA